MPPGPAEWKPVLESAAREVFEVMLKTKLEPVAADSHAATEMIAMVGLSGGLNGMVSFHCTVDAARRMAAKMLHSESQQPEDTARDAVGEICNMVAGSFQNHLGQTGADCKLSVPIIIAGGACSMQTETMGVHVKVPFRFEGSPIFVALDLRN